MRYKEGSIPSSTTSSTQPSEAHKQTQVRLLPSPPPLWGCSLAVRQRIVTPSKDNQLRPSGAANFSLSFRYDVQKRRKRSSPKKKAVTKKPSAPRLKTARPATRLRPPPAPKPSGLVDQARDHVREFKKHYNTCADCLREYPPYVLEFDHVDPTTKRFNVGHASAAPSMEALLAEIEKCDIVCSNCHKIREYKRKKDPTFVP